ncbi:MAG: polysaccharide deacetylase family protein [Dehalococcoidales bacterium]
MKKLPLICLLLLTLFLVFGCQQNIVATPIPPATIPPDAKLVSLFFDDGFLNQYEVALPVLREYGFRATFGVITGSIGKGHGLWQYMDKKHIKALADSGMDIASHTVDHVSLTANVTDKQLRHEVFDSKKQLEGMGFKVTTMVYPYYEWNDRVIACVRDAGYTCARAGWSNQKAYDLTTADPNARYHVFSWQITNQDMDTFKLYLKEAGPTTLVGLTYHFISDSGPVNTSTPLANFKAQMAYLKEAGYTVVPLPQIFINK